MRELENGETQHGNNIWKYFLDKENNCLLISFLLESFFANKLKTSMIFGNALFFTPPVINLDYWAQILMGFLAGNSWALFLIEDYIVLNAGLCLYLQLINMQMHLHTILEDSHYGLQNQS